MKKNKKWIIGAILALFLSFSVLSLNVNAEEKEKEYKEYPHKIGDIVYDEDGNSYYYNPGNPYYNSKGYVGGGDIVDLSEIPNNYLWTFNSSISGYSTLSNGWYRLSVSSDFSTTSFNLTYDTTGGTPTYRNVPYIVIQKSASTFKISAMFSGGVSTTTLYDASTGFSTRFHNDILNLSSINVYYSTSATGSGPYSLITPGDTEYDKLLTFINNNVVVGPPTTYTISFNSNGADSGTVPANTSVIAGTTYTLPGNTGNLEKLGYTFIGWNTSSTATTALTTYTINANTTFYAIWEQTTTYSISFDSNGADSGTVPASTSVNAGTVYTLPGNTGNLVKAGYTFIGWNTSSTATTALTTYTVNANTIFYAVWQVGTPPTPTAYTINFNSNGADSGTTPASTSVNAGTVYTLPGNTGNLVKAGYTFIGWNTNPNYTTAITQTTINANTIFYAIWERDETALRKMTLQITVNGNLCYTADMVVMNNDTYMWSLNGFETGRLLELRFNDINYLRTSYKNDNIILMDYTDRVLFTFLTFDMQTLSLYIDGNLSVDGTMQQWQEYFAERAWMDMPFYENHVILIAIQTDETSISPIGSFRAIVANIVGGFEALFSLNFGWITLGGIISIVLTFSVVFFIFKLVRGGGGS